MQLNPITLWKSRSQGIAPGMRSLISSLSAVTVCFAGSKVFSSIAMIIMARVLGKDVFGQASVILKIAQVLSPLMLLGLHMAAVQFGSGKKEQACYVSTTFYFALVSVAAVSGLAWILEPAFVRWMDLLPGMMEWSIGLAVIMSGYLLFTHYYQMVAEYRARGLVELALGVCLLPALLIGVWLKSKSFEAVLITYAVAYLCCLPPMLWRFRHMLPVRYLFKCDWKEMLKYGSLACFSGFGFILFFVVQPLQLNYYTDAGQVGMFLLYSGSSLSLATFATTIFYTVVFSKVAASSNKKHIWHLLTKAWVRVSLPLTVCYAVVFSISVTMAGPQYPLSLERLILFSVASTVITIQTTFGQTLAAHGVRGIRWVLIISIGTGLTNFATSALLIPAMGLNGAVVALILNFTAALILTTIVHKLWFGQLPPQPVSPD